MKKPVKKLTKAKLAKLEKELAKEAARWESDEVSQDPKDYRLLSKAEEAAVDEKAGLRMISVRLPIRDVEALKDLASAHSLKYQPYLRKIIRDHIDRQDMRAWGQVIKTDPTLQNLLHEAAQRLAQRISDEDALVPPLGRRTLGSRFAFDSEENDDWSPSA